MGYMQAHVLERELKVRSQKRPDIQNTNGRRHEFMGNKRTKSCEIEGGLIRSRRRSKISNEGPDEVQFPVKDLQVGESWLA